MKYFLAGLISMIVFSSCKFHHQDYDKIIRNGMIYDGNGGEPYKADIGIKDDTIAFIGDLSGISAQISVDAKGMAVAPGFINMLSWANESLIEDGLSQGDIRQGVTLEVMGEGESMGPLNEKMKQTMIEAQADIKFDIKWTTLGEYLGYLVQPGVSCNV